jgi:hypothetical protein
VTHEEAWKRLPDLLDDRDEAKLLAHVRACPTCQRQLFLLGRVDRMLRNRAPEHGATRTCRPNRRILFPAIAATLAVAVATIALLVPRSSHPHGFVLHTATGRSIGEAMIGRSDARNASLMLNARGLPVGRGRIFVLWAGDERSSMQVGRFMVDRTGGCRVHFNLPATHSWHRFWVTRPGEVAAVVAST